VRLQLPDESLGFEAVGAWQTRTLMNDSHLTGLRFLNFGEREASRLWAFVQERATELTRFLESSDLRGIPVEDLLTIALGTRLRELPQGARVFHPGQRDGSEDSIFVVLRGSVLMEMHESFMVIGAGRLLGGLRLVTSLPNGSSARAASELELLEINPYTMRFLEWARPSAARSLMQCTARVHIERLHGAMQDTRRRQQAPGEGA
jgi:CRP-like cAMP-binding protein